MTTYKIIILLCFLGSTCIIGYFINKTMRLYNKIIIVIEKLSSEYKATMLPIPGQVTYDDANNRFIFYDGKTWGPCGGKFKSVNLSDYGDCMTYHRWKKEWIPFNPEDCFFLNPRLTQVAILGCDLEDDMDENETIFVQEFTLEEYNRIVNWGFPEVPLYIRKDAVDLDKEKERTKRFVDKLNKEKT